MLGARHAFVGALARLCNLGHLCNPGTGAPPAHRIIAENHNGTRRWVRWRPDRRPPMWFNNDSEVLEIRRHIGGN